MYRFARVTSGLLATSGRETVSIANDAGRVVAYVVRERNGYAVLDAGLKRLSEGHPSLDAAETSYWSALKKVPVFDLRAKAI
jgi:hypothetical protein